MILNKNKYTLSQFIMHLFFIYMITFHLFSYRSETTIVSNSVMLLLLMSLFLYFLRHRQFILSWRLFFVLSWNLLVIAGYFWSPLQTSTLIKWFTVFKLSLVLLLFSHYLDTNKKIEQALRCMLYSYIVLAAYMVYVYGFSIFSTGVIDTRYGSEISQINVLGMSLAYGAVLSFYYFYIHKKKYMLFLVIAFPVLSSFTGSRKAIIIIVLGVIGLLLQDVKRDKKKLIIYISIVILIAAIFSSLSYFDLVFSRFEGLLSIVTGESSLDYSSAKRLDMIKKGMEFFWESPIIGNGFDSYRFYWSAYTQKDTYSHINYVELLVSGGILAIIIFYGNYIYLIFKMQKKKSEISKLLMILLMLTLIIDIFVVSYVSKNTYIMIAIYYAYIYNYEIKK